MMPVGTPPNAIVFGTGLVRMPQMIRSGLCLKLSGIVVIFVLGLFWKRANEAGAIAAAVGSFALSIALKLAWPELPFMDRVGLVFLLALALAVVVSLTLRASSDPNRIRTDDVSYATTSTFNAGAVGVIGILIALYAAFW